SKAGRRFFRRVPGLFLAAAFLRRSRGRHGGRLRGYDRCRGAIYRERPLTWRGTILRGCRFLYHLRPEQRLYLARTGHGFRGAHVTLDRAEILIANDAFLRGEHDQAFPGSRLRWRDIGPDNLPYAVQAKRQALEAIFALLIGARPHFVFVQDAVAVRVDVHN